MADEPFDRALRRAVRRPADAGACPDSSELAALVENALSREERAIVEAHAAACDRCAAELAALVRLPALDIAEQAGAGRKFFAWRWRWAIPLATAVVVFAVWSETSREPAPPAAPAARVQTREQAPAPPPRPSAPSAREAPVEAQRADPATRGPVADDVRGQELRKQDLGERDPGGQEPARQKSAPAAAADSREEPAQTLSDDRHARVQAAPAAMPAAPSDREAEGDAAERRPEAFSAPAGAPSAAGARPEATLSRALPGQAPLIVRASDLVQVRVSGDRIERTADGGATWQTERSGLVAPLLSGACPAPDVCWLGGVRGRIVRREASGRWVDVAIPADGSVTAIDAPDAARAAVTLADGRRFVTSDGGGSWSAAR